MRKTTLFLSIAGALALSGCSAPDLTMMDVLPISAFLNGIFWLASLLFFALGREKRKRSKPEEYLAGDFLSGEILPFGGFAVLMSPILGWNLLVNVVVMGRIAYMLGFKGSRFLEGLVVLSLLALVLIFADALAISLVM